MSWVLTVFVGYRTMTFHAAPCFVVNTPLTIRNTSPQVSSKRQAQNKWVDPKSSPWCYRTLQTEQMTPNQVPNACSSWPPGTQVGTISTWTNHGDKLLNQNHNVNMKRKLQSISKATCHNYSVVGCSRCIFTQAVLPIPRPTQTLAFLLQAFPVSRLEAISLRGLSEQTRKVSTHWRPAGCRKCQLQLPLKHTAHKWSRFQTSI